MRRARRVFFEEKLGLWRGERCDIMKGISEGLPCLRALKVN